MQELVPSVLLLDSFPYRVSVRNESLCRLFLLLQKFGYRQDAGDLCLFHVRFL